MEAPRFLGIDEQGRETLSWTDGTPSTLPWPDALRTDDGVAKLGQLLRRFHDAVASFAPAAAAQSGGPVPEPSDPMRS